MIPAFIIILAIGLIVIALGLYIKVYEAGYRQGHDEGWDAAGGDMLPPMDEADTWQLTESGHEVLAQHRHYNPKTPS